MKKLLDWYRGCKREMPWRGHPDPYAVWVSEIMLQQTQVDTVRDYFIRFVAKFPTIRSLAEADTESLLKAWEGLGYYTRAKNLRKAAQLVMEKHGGKVPRTAEELQTLPGIGPYTAAAVASICFGQPVPVVDGNVARVLPGTICWTMISRNFRLALNWRNGSRHSSKKAGVPAISTRR